jgi:hypothetical protein
MDIEHARHHTNGEILFALLDWHALPPHVHTWCEGMPFVQFLNEPAGIVIQRFRQHDLHGYILIPASVTF